MKRLSAFDETYDFPDSNKESTEEEKQRKQNRINRMLMEDIRYKHIKNVRDDLKRGADVHHRDEEGLCPLERAVEKGYVPVFRSLLDAGASINDENCGSELMPLAIINGHVRMIKELLSLGIDIHADESICFSASDGNLEIFKLLVDAGADINTVGSSNFNNLSVLEIAIDDGNMNIISFLIKNGVAVNEKQWSEIENYVSGSEKEELKNIVMQKTSRLKYK